MVLSPNNAEQKQWLEVRMPREPPIAVLFEDIPGLYFTVAQRLPGPRMSLSVFFHPMNPSETTFLERPRWRGAVMSFKKKESVG